MSESKNISAQNWKMSRRQDKNETGWQQTTWSRLRKQKNAQGLKWLKIQNVWGQGLSGVDINAEPLEALNPLSFSSSLKI